MTRKNERPDSFGMGPRHGLRPCKGQLISKGLFGILEKFDLSNPYTRIQKLNETINKLGPE